MSLLTKPPHTVQVQLRSLSPDPVRGKLTLTNAGTPVSVACSVQPLNSADRLVLGATTDTTRKIIAKTWPGDMNSLVTWDGFDWDTVGDPQHFSMSAKTDHFEVVITKRGAHV